MQLERCSTKTRDGYLTTRSRDPQRSNRFASEIRSQTNLAHFRRAPLQKRFCAEKLFHNHHPARIFAALSSQRSSFTAHMSLAPKRHRCLPRTSTSLPRCQRICSTSHSVRPTLIIFSLVARTAEHYAARKQEARPAHEAQA